MPMSRPVLPKFQACIITNIPDTPDAGENERDITRALQKKQAIINALPKKMDIHYVDHGFFGEKIIFSMEQQNGILHLPPIQREHQEWKWGWPPEIPSLESVETFVNRALLAAQEWVQDMGFKPAEIINEKKITHR